MQDENKYGINRVVGGFMSSVTDETRLPWTLARTGRELFALQGLFQAPIFYSQAGLKLAEFGSGYGRLFPAWNNVSTDFVGFERDRELSKIAADIYPEHSVGVKTLASVPLSDGDRDVSLTWTVLQHLEADEVRLVAKEMKRVTRLGGHILICEEENPKLIGPDCFGRSSEEYGDLFELPVVDWYLRTVEFGLPSGRITILRA